MLTNWVVLLKAPPTVSHPAQAHAAFTLSHYPVPCLGAFVENGCKFHGAPGFALRPAPREPLCLRAVHGRVAGGEGAVLVQLLAQRFQTFGRFQRFGQASQSFSPHEQA